MQKGNAPSSYSPNPTWGGSSIGQSALGLLARNSGDYSTGFNSAFGRPSGTSSSQGTNFGQAFNQFFQPSFFNPVPGMPYPGQRIPPWMPFIQQFQQQPKASSFNDPAKPSWGGWAWGDVPVQNVIDAGFDWFEVGYPDTISSADYQRLQQGGVTPFAYINLGELDPTLSGVAGYSGPVLRTNSDWGTQLVDVTNQTWQNWLVRRAMDAYALGARGIKWDVATPDVPPGRTRADVNAAIASVMQRIRAQAPDMRFVYNQGFDFATAYPQYVNGIQTEGLFSATSYPGAYLQPWKDPWFWGPQYDQVKQLAASGIPVFAAEYTDPAGGRAQELYNAIAGQGFVPYITSENWQARGLGYNINAGW
jgi:endo-alpha-1,4-polygalactosaminidase (GH114 family)